MDEHEDMLRRQLSDLRRDYERLAKPIIDRLVAIENARPPKPIHIMLAQLSEADRMALAMLDRNAAWLPDDWLPAAPQRGD